MTYDFSCRKCGYTGEQAVPVAERNTTKCPKCGAFLVNVTQPTTRIVVPRSFQTNWEDINDHPRVDHTGV